MRRLACFLFALALGAVACGSDDAEPAAESSAAPTPVIVDYSPTFSDVGGLLYLLEHPDVSVEAITLPGTGEAGCELGVEVTLRILALVDRTEIPVACDPLVPEGARAWPSGFLQDQDALVTGLPALAGEADARSPDQLIADVVAAADAPVVVYAVAPLTNLARTFDRHPEVADGIGRVVIMGGAVDVAGNVPRSDAEWNIWIDVPAAAEALRVDVPITLVTLDATNDVPVPAVWSRDLAAAAESAATGYLAGLIDLFPNVTGGLFFLWDELAASVAAGDGLVAVESMRVSVSLDEGISYGATRRDPDGAPVDVAVGVPDPSAFYDRFLATLGGAPLEPLSVLQVETGSSPPALEEGAGAELVLARWLYEGSAGSPDAAHALVAPGAAWVGLGASPEAYVDGGQPFEAFDVALACDARASVAACTMTFQDRWMVEVPELDRATLEVVAEVRDGSIVDFTAFTFDAATIAAFEAHVAWLSGVRPEDVAAACADPAAAECSRLLVETAGEWVASR